MSMHEIESFVEIAIKAIANSQIPTVEKRNTIYTLFKLECMGDCGFTNLRTINEMVACQYTFLFNKEEMYDYEARKSFYDNLENEKCFDMGYVYPYNGKVCVDSGSDAWAEMVKKGAITGYDAIAVNELNYADALRKSKELIGELDEYTSEGLLALFYFSEAIKELIKDEYVPLFGLTYDEVQEMIGN